MTEEQKVDTSTITRNDIDMVAVESSQIAAIGHDSESNTLAIAFKSSADEYQYRYAGVTAEMFDEMKNNDSVGGYFHQNIKQMAHKHPAMKMRLDEIGTTSAE